MTNLTTLFPAYQGSDPFVFVCYAHADQEAVATQLWSLREQGLNIWYDEGISSGHVAGQSSGESIAAAPVRARIN